MKNPQYLDEKDKYILLSDDFETPFEKYIFAAIHNLHKDGSQSISIVDIDTYFEPHPVPQQVFYQNDGLSYLQDALDFAQKDNFPFYYKRLKKFNALRDLQKLGYNTQSIYETNLLNKDSQKINEKFEELEIQDIFDLVKKDLIKVETDYSTGDASETLTAQTGILDLVKELEVRPEVGAPLQGAIFNTVVRGARKSKFYIRSSSSGVGKSRSAVGDACYLAYPLRFNQTSWQWENIGSAEKTLFVATEQEIDEIQTLILAYLTGFNEEKILYSQYTEKEKIVVHQALKVMNMYKDNFYIVRIPNPSIEQVRAVIRRNWILYDIENVFYDYIFSSPSLLNEFRDLRVRTDEALMMLSTALKDLAVEMNLFIMSSTQTNAKVEERGRELANESVVRGSRAIIDKADIACVIDRIDKSEREIIAPLVEELGIEPNHVMDIFKVRRGKYTNVRVWSKMDLGTCRKEDLFVTDQWFNLIEGFKIHSYIFEGSDLVTINEQLRQLDQVDLSVGESPQLEKIELKEIEKKTSSSSSLFGDYL